MGPPPLSSKGSFGVFGLVRSADWPLNRSVHVPSVTLSTRVNSALQVPSRAVGGWGGTVTVAVGAVVLVGAAAASAAESGSALLLQAASRTITTDAAAQ